MPAHPTAAHTFPLPLFLLFGDVTVYCWTLIRWVMFLGLGGTPKVLWLMQLSPRPLNYFNKSWLIQAEPVVVGMATWQVRWHRLQRQIISVSFVSFSIFIDLFVFWKKEMHHLMPTSGTRRLEVIWNCLSGFSDECDNKVKGLALWQYDVYSQKHSRCSTQNDLNIIWLCQGGF